MTGALFQCVDAIGVTGVIRRFNVEIAGLFLERYIPGALNREVVGVKDFHGGRNA